MQEFEQQNSAYSVLLKEFTEYKEKTIEEKEALLKELEKCKSYIDRFKDKVEKKWENRVTDERMAGADKLQRESKLFKRQISTLRQVIEVKDKLIDDLKNEIKLLDAQRKQIIETNTKMLLDINQDLSYPPAEGKYSHSYTELLRMYQYLISENNELKKHIKQHEKHVKQNQKHQINHHKSMLIENTAKGEPKSQAKIIKEKAVPLKKTKK